MVPQNAPLKILVVAAALALVGCAAPFATPGAGALPPPTDAYPRGTSPADPPTGTAGPGTDGRQPAQARPPNQAAVALLTASREASASGDFSAAAITLERALAIDPNNAALWVELAEVRARQGDRDQADSLARKALTLAGSDRLVISRAERLIGGR